MKKTVVSVLTAAAVGFSAAPAVAHKNPVYANEPRLSGSVATGRIIATGGTTSGIPWDSYQKVECRIQKRYGARWVDNVFAPGGRRTSSGSYEASVTQAAETGRFRNRCRLVLIHRGKGYVKFGKWVQSRAVTIRGW